MSVFGLPLPRPRPANSPEFLIPAGRGRVIFERGGELYTDLFPAAERLLKVDCERHAVSVALNYCTGLVAENSAAREGEPKAIVIHVPPQERAKEYPGHFANAASVVPTLLQAMPKPTRVELVGSGKGGFKEIETIKRELAQKGISVIIQPEHVGGADPVRWVELRPQKGKPTVFNYDVKYVLRPKERFKLEGMGLGLSGQALIDYIQKNLHDFYAIIREGRLGRGDTPVFR